MIAAYLCVGDYGAQILEADEFRTDWYGPLRASERDYTVYQIAVYDTDVGYDYVLDRPRHPQHVIPCCGWEQLAHRWMEATGGVELEVSA